MRGGVERRAGGRRGDGADGADGNRAGGLRQAARRVVFVGQIGHGFVRDPRDLIGIVVLVGRADAVAARQAGQAEVGVVGKRDGGAAQGVGHVRQQSAGGVVGVVHEKRAGVVSGGNQPARRVVGGRKAAVVGRENRVGNPTLGIALERAAVGGGQPSGLVVGIVERLARGMHHAGDIAGGIIGRHREGAIGENRAREFAARVIGIPVGPAQRVHHGLERAQRRVPEDPRISLGIDDARQFAQRIVFVEGVRLAAAACRSLKAAAFVGIGAFETEGIAEGGDPAHFVVGDFIGVAQRIDHGDGPVEGVEDGAAGAAQRRDGVGGRARRIVIGAPRAPGDAGFDEAAAGIVGIGGFHADGVGFPHKLSGGIVFVGINAPGAVHGTGDLPGGIVGVAG